jgi:hypothetical protein
LRVFSSRCTASHKLGVPGFSNRSASRRIAPLAAKNLQAVENDREKSAGRSAQKGVAVRVVRPEVRRSQIHKLSAEVELTKPAPHTVLNNK